MALSHLNKAQVTTGNSQFYIAIKVDSTLWAWNDDAHKTANPEGMSTLKGITAVASGQAQILVLDRDSTVWYCGPKGQVPPMPGKPWLLNVAFRNPRPLRELGAIKAISSGEYYSVVLKADGTVWQWRFEPQKVFEPRQMVGLTEITAIACGDLWMLALAKDSTVWEWQLPERDPDYGSWLTAPIELEKVPGLRGIVSVASDGWYHAALKSDGTVSFWGAGGSDQQMQVIGLDSITDIEISWAMLAGIRQDSSVWYWPIPVSKKELGLSADQVTELNQIVALGKAARSGELTAVDTEGNLWRFERPVITRGVNATVVPKTVNGVSVLVPLSKETED